MDCFHNKSAFFGHEQLLLVNDLQYMSYCSEDTKEIPMNHHFGRTVPIRHLFIE